MARPQGSRTVLVRITYDDIGRLAGIAGDTARQYARRGLFDARDLESVLSWVNGRRQQQGLPVIGAPTDNTSDEPSSAPSKDDDPGPVASTPARMEASPLYYDPRSASYRVNGT